MILSDETRPTPEAIVLGVPTFGMVSIYWHQQMMTLLQTYKPMNRAIVPCVVKGREVAEARNQIVNYALSLEDDQGVKATHVFFVDDDVIISYDGLLALVAHNKPIVAGLYYAKTPIPQPLLFDAPYKGASTDWEPGDIRPCYAHGMGYTLISTDVFRAIEPPWFKTTKGAWDGPQEFKSQTEDVYFCEKAIAAGFQPTVDTGLLGLHYDHRIDSGFPADAWQAYKDGGEIRVKVAA